MNRKQTIFLTGATGLAGSYMLDFLLKRGNKIYVLARSKEGVKAADRIENILVFWNKKDFSKNFENLIVLEGDITKKNLGLSAKNIKLLSKELDVIYHSAALTKFNADIKESRRVNVQGTKNILEFARSLNSGKLKKVNYFSTIYVRGDYTGTFKENDLDVGQKFVTSYERTKFEAEKIVKVYRKKGMDINIFRMGAIIGETKSGKITKFENIYQILHIWSLQLLDFCCIPNAKVDLSPVDVIVKMIYFLSMHSGKKNANYHLIPYALPMRKFFNYAQRYLKFKKPVVKSRNDIKKENLSVAQKVLLEKVTLLSLIASGKVSAIATNNILKKKKFHLTHFSKKQLDKIFNYASIQGAIKKVGKVG